MKIRYLLLALSLVSVGANAGNSTLDATIGGAAGAAIGNEVGGRDGAILGGALGAAIGTSGHTDGNAHKDSPSVEMRYESTSPRGGNSGYHCPPGQAKKGRC